MINDEHVLHVLSLSVTFPLDFQAAKTRISTSAQSVWTVLQMGS